MKNDKKVFVYLPENRQGKYFKKNELVVFLDADIWIQAKVISIEQNHSVTIGIDLGEFRIKSKFCIKSPKILKKTEFAFLRENLEKYPGFILKWFSSVTKNFNLHKRNEYINIIYSGCKLKKKEKRELEFILDLLALKRIEGN